jgi:hypothetical protein
MRLVKPLLSAALFFSILINVVLIYKVRGKRAIITINGTPITRTEMNNYLELAYGPQYKATMVQRVLIDQEAHQQGVAPTDAEVQEEFDAKRELDWSYAQKLARAPWLTDEAKEEIKLENEEEHLLAKDIPVTDEEVRDEYQQNPQVYDTPNKAKCTVAAILNDTRTEDVKRMLLSQSPPYSPAIIASNYPHEVIFLGDNNHFTFAQPFNTQFNASVFAMPPRTVRVEPAGELAQLGAKKIIIRMDEIIPGHVADLSDPKTIKKIKLRVQLHRARPASELLTALWQKANMVFDDQTDRTNTELLFFPDKSKAQSK